MSECGICKNSLGAYGGNNSAPLRAGKVCDDCNILYVIPARLFGGRERD